jgi:hypothetical protein
VKSLRVEQKVFDYKPREQFLDFHNRHHRWACMVVHRRGGKALDVFTPMLLTTGIWTEMGKLKAGDEIFDDRGFPTKVLQAHPFMYNRPCYAVEFDDGSTIIADHEHLWHTQTKYDRANRTGRVRDSITRKMSSGYPAHLPGCAKTTADIRDSLTARGERNHSVRLAGALQHPVRELPVDPYILGLWLGDGHSLSAKFTTADEEIVESLREFSAVAVNGPYAFARSITQSQNTGKASVWAITCSSGKNKKTNSLIAILRELGVKGNKHIPAMYLSAHVEARQALLQGLMDTDGSIDPHTGRKCEITQKSRQLADGIMHLLRSLGEKPSIHPKRINATTYWRINFCPAFNPFRLQRKALLFKSPKAWGFGRNRRIVAVTPVESRPVRCITVDSPSNLYLCGRELIPTHNTYATLADIILKALHTNKKNARYAYIAPFRTQAKDVAWTYLKLLTEGMRDGPPGEAALRIKLFNGSWITLYGADNPDALRGLYFDGIALDEFGDMRPGLLGEIILPTLVDRKGWLVLMGTVKGRNALYHAMIKAEADPLWFYKRLSASSSGILPQEDLDQIKSQMSPEQYDQEFELNIDAALKGTYYTQILNELRNQGRFLARPLFDPEQKVHVASDIGYSDGCAFWFWQPRPDGFAIIDYYENNGKGPDHYLQMFKDKGYQYEEIWLPHDAKAKTFQSKRSTIEQFMHPHETCPQHYEKGTRLPLRITPRMAVQHGIDAVRMFLRECWFDENKCVKGIDSLRMYSRRWNEISRVFDDKPKHDEFSHGSDAFRCVALVAKGSRGFSAEAMQRTRKGFGRMGESATLLRGSVQIKDGRLMTSETLEEMLTLSLNKRHRHRI